MMIRIIYKITNNMRYLLFDEQKVINKLIHLQKTLLRSYVNRSFGLISDNYCVRS